MDAEYYAKGGINEINRLFQRWGMLKTERATWMPHWKELSDYIMPRSGRFFIADRDRGQKRHNNIYDSTGTRAARVLGAGLMGGATSPARPWFRYGTSDPELAESPAVKAWLKIATDLTLDVFAKSNTYRTLQGHYEELGVFGTSASVFMDDFKNVISHYPSTVGEFAISTTYKGDVNTFAREFQKPVSMVVEEFGYENCSKTVQNMHDRNNLDAWVTLIHMIEPRVDREPGKLDAKNMAFKSCYFELGRDNDKYLREGGTKTFRALCPRWGVSGGDIYGNGPGMEALGDIKQLQHEQLRKAEAIDFQTKPPLQYPSSLKNMDVNRMPGGGAYVDMSNPGSKIQTMFDVKLDLSALLMDIQDVRERIKSAFYTDLFLMLANDQGDKTATEVAELHEEKLLMLGPVLERLHNELYSPLIDMTFQRILEAGMLPPPPPELHGQELNVEFISMLAQAQRAVSTNSVDRFVMSMGTLAQLGKPNVLDKFDEDKWADKYSDMLGIDPELIVADDKVALVRKNRADQQAQQQKAAAMEQQSKTAKNLAQSPTGNKNALTDVTSAFSGYSTPQS